MQWKPSELPLISIPFQLVLIKLNFWKDSQELIGFQLKY